MSNDLRPIALRALEHHGRRYGVTIPQRLRDFYATDFRAHDRKFIEAKAPYAEAEVFQLSLTMPTWHDVGDDAINGVDGEWEEAGVHLPIFEVIGDRKVVVDLRSEACAVAWYAEGFILPHEPGSRISDSLDAFLARLTADHGRDDLDLVMTGSGEAPQRWEDDFADDEE